MVERVVGDVLADPVASAAAQTDDRRETGELARHRALEAFERVAVYDKREICEQVIGGHVRRSLSGDRGRLRFGARRYPPCSAWLFGNSWPFGSVSGS